jgi:AcrR family transcriptional regulator
MIAKNYKLKSKPTRHSRRANATRAKLLNAAQAIFSEKGLDLTSIDDITNRADVGKGTFYYHFRDRDDIVQTLIKKIIDELLTVIDESCKDIRDLKGAITALLDAHIKFFCNRWEDFVLYFQGRSELILEHSYEGIETPFINYLERVEEIIASSIQRRLSKSLLHRIACAVVGFVSGYYSFVSISVNEEDVDETFHSMRNAMVESLSRFIQETQKSTDLENWEPQTR